MKDLMTRNEAAEILNVRPQTISNWIEKGLLSCVVMHNRKMIERASFERLKDTLSDVADTEKAIIEYKECIKREEERLKDVIRSLRSEYYFLAPCRTEIKGYFSKAYKVLSKGIADERTIDCVCRFLDGETYDEIAERYGLKRERTRQIVEKGIRMLYRVESYGKVIDDNRRLNIELEQVNLRFKILQESYTNLQKQMQLEQLQNIDVKMPPIFSTKLTDLDLSRRCLNCISYTDIETVYDLVQFKDTDLLKFRNFGKKSLLELEELLDEYGLWLGMTNDDILNMKV